MTIFLRGSAAAVALLCGTSAFAQVPPADGLELMGFLWCVDYIEKNLQIHGWTLVTIDIQWYEPLAHSDRYREGGEPLQTQRKVLLGRGGLLGGTATGRYDSVVCIADNIWGPYSHWHEAVPCGGGTNYFQDKEGNWFDCYLGNDEQTPFREKPGIIKVDFDSDGRTFFADDQPSFIKQDGAPLHWRNVWSHQNAK